jgi:hypothetical protein
MHSEIFGHWYTGSYKNYKYRTIVRKGRGTDHYIVPPNHYIIKGGLDPQNKPLGAADPHLITISAPHARKKPQSVNERPSIH